MAGNPFFQDLDPYAVPDAITPYDAPSDTAGYVGVTPPGTGAAPAPYDIAAPQDIAGITAANNAAMALTGGGEGADTGAGSGGMPNRDSPRQRESLAILDSPQGAASSNVFAGFPDYENQDVRPGADLQTPIQGQMGTYPVDNTYQPGLPQFMAGVHGLTDLPGVPPESGSMGPSKGMDYPGTTQDGITKYGTS